MFVTEHIRTIIIYSLEIRPKCPAVPAALACDNRSAECFTDVMQDIRQLINIHDEYRRPIASLDGDASASGWLQRLRATKATHQHHQPHHLWRQNTCWRCAHFSLPAARAMSTLPALYRYFTRQFVGLTEKNC